MEDNSKINTEKSEKKPEYDDVSIFVNADSKENLDDDLPSFDEETAPKGDNSTPNDEKNSALDTDNSESSEDNSESLEVNSEKSEEDNESSEEDSEKSEDDDGFPIYSGVQELSDEEILNGKDFDFSNIEKIQAQIEQNMPQELAELLKDDDEENDEDYVVKKYNVYISKDFVPYIDNLSTNELSAYINDAIQKKIDIEESERTGERKQRILGHFIVAIITAIIFTPVLLYTAHKSITTTLNNYKYSQDNFEKLYADKLKKNSVYTRSLKYNKLHKVD